MQLILSRPGRVTGPVLGACGRWHARVTKPAMCPAVRAMATSGFTGMRRTHVSMYPEEVQEVVYASGAVACLRLKQRTDDGNLAMLAASAAIEGGLNVVEVTMDSPGAAQVIHALRREFPDCVIGAGTVLSSSQVDMAVAAGAQVLMSPVLDKGVLRRAQHHGVLFVPGVMTPSEAVKASQLGAECVKLFPAGAEGVALVRAMQGALPNLDVLPSHGITLDLADEYLDAGSPAVVLSGCVFDKEEMERGDTAAIAARASAAARRVKLAKRRAARCGSRPLVGPTNMYQ